MTFAVLLAFITGLEPSVNVGPDAPFDRVSNQILLSEPFVAAVKLSLASIVEQASRTDVSGDDRTEVLVRSAAFDERLPADLQIRAVIMSLAIAFDQTEAFRASILTKRFWEAYESPTERARRLKVIGQPTILNREDLAVHFFAAAGLTAIASPESAEAVCILKEVSDANGGTGFSFVDLAANLAGIIYAQKSIMTKPMDANLVMDFQIRQFVPDVQGLREGIMIEELRSDFSFDSKSRFQAAVARIRERVLLLPVYSGGPATVHAGETPDP